MVTKDCTRDGIENRTRLGHGESIRMRNILACVIGPIFLACSATSTAPPQVADAGPNDASPSALPESGVPIIDSGPPPDGGNMCDRLKETVDQKSALARACNPQSPSECTAAIDGLCCSVTVSASKTGAVNDFQEAINNYKAKCKPDCTKVFCGLNPAPSNICDTASASCR